MTPITFSLPWPPATLSPNGSHGHWRTRAKAKKSYRDACYVSVLEQCVPKPTAASLDLELLFVPPGHHRFDRDNLVARMKAGLDGVARAWGIDDHAFVRIAAEVSGVPRRDGHVLVTVRERATQVECSGLHGPDVSVGLLSPGLARHGEPGLFSGRSAR